MPARDPVRPVGRQAGPARSGPTAGALSSAHIAAMSTMTALQRRLGIQTPIIQAPMAGVQGSALAIAVAEAGGLGSLPCAML